MILITYLIVVSIFCVSFYFTHVVHTCQNVITETQQAKTALLDKSLDDEEKEKIAQKASLVMLKNSFILLIKLTIIFSLTLSPMLIFDYFSIASFEAVSQFALRIDVLIITTIVISLLIFLYKKL